jgi:hypothetical protein
MLLDEMKGQRTCIVLNLCKPLFLQLLILPITSPAIGPILLLLIPLFTIALLVRDTLGSCKLLPFGGWFGFRQGLLAGEEVVLGWELGEGAFV